MIPYFSLTRGCWYVLRTTYFLCRRTESIESLERGVYSCEELEVFSCCKGWNEACQPTRTISSTRRRELSSRSCFSNKARRRKEIHAILQETLGENAPSYVTVKNWVAQFKRGDFSTCHEPRPGRIRTVTTPEIIDQIHELILEDRRISAKSIAERLGISRERVGFIIHEDLNMRKISTNFLRDSNDFLSPLVIMEETWSYHYDVEIKQQSLERWHSGTPHPKVFRVQKSAWNFSPRFLGWRQHLPHWLSSKGPNNQRGVLLISAGAIEVKF